VVSGEKEERGKKVNEERGKRGGIQLVAAEISYKNCLDIEIAFYYDKWMVFSPFDKGFVTNVVLL